MRFYYRLAIFFGLFSIFAIFFFQPNLLLVTTLGNFSGEKFSSDCCINKYRILIKYIIIVQSPTSIIHTFTFSAIFYSEIIDVSIVSSEPRNSIQLYRNPQYSFTRQHAHYRLENQLNVRCLFVIFPRLYTFITRGALYETTLLDLYVDFKVINQQRQLQCLPSHREFWEVSFWRISVYPFVVVMLFEKKTDHILDIEFTIFKRIGSDYYIYI